jgi:hypothetical protein
MHQTGISLCFIPAGEGYDIAPQPALFIMHSYSTPREFPGVEMLKLAPLAAPFL